MTIWRIIIEACIVLPMLVSAPEGAHACMPSSIDFGFGSSQLGPAGRSEVTYVVEELRRTRNGRVMLIAQTDGSDGNVRMSRRRAQVIRESLVRHGVPATSVSIELRGPSDHMISGENAARRVVLLVVSGLPNLASGC